jgi:hypothetical protein
LRFHLEDEKKFWSDSAGTYNIWYTVKDMGNNYQQSSRHDAIIVSRPEITIKSPAPDSMFTYTTGSPGVLQIRASAKVKPDYLAKYLVWSITPVTGSTLTTIPTCACSTEVNFRFQGLPADNNQFGKKYIKVSLPNYNVAESVLVRFYYPSDATNHPGQGMGLTPNWYYYWGQTPANLEPDDYGGTYCNDSTYGYFHLWGYTSAENMFHICDLASFINLSRGYPSRSTGIDCFSETCLHEHKHYSNWWGWWGHHQYDSTYADRDGDYIPSVLEPLMGFDSTQRDSDNDRIDDEEETAYDAMRNWIPNSIDSLDWANPGHQR